MSPGHPNGPPRGGPLLQDHSPPHECSVSKPCRTLSRPTRPQTTGTHLQRPCVGSAWHWWRVGLVLGCSASGRVVGICHVLWSHVPWRQPQLEEGLPLSPHPGSSAEGEARWEGWVRGQGSPASQVQQVGIQPGPVAPRACADSHRQLLERRHKPRGPKPVSLNLKRFY